VVVVASDLRGEETTKISAQFQKGFRKNGNHPQ
jgi:hypothetical protein